VLDAGLRVWSRDPGLIKRLPRGRVIAVDGSAGMIAAARRRLGDSAELILSDLTTLDLGGRQVDAVFSTAVFIGSLIRPPFSAYPQGWSPWNFAGPRETADRLCAAASPTSGPSLCSVLDEVEGKLGLSCEVTYIRLDIDATRAEGRISLR
jgi:hypothetical protein